MDLEPAHEAEQLVVARPELAELAIGKIERRIATRIEVVRRRRGRRRGKTPGAHGART